MRLVSDILKLMKVYKCFNSKGRSLTLIKTYPFLYKQTNVQTKLICLNIVYIHTVRCAIGSHSQFIENVVSSQCMKFASVLDLLTNVHLHLVGNMFHYSFLFLSLCYFPSSSLSLQLSHHSYLFPYWLSGTCLWFCGILPCKQACFTASILPNPLNLSLPQVSLCFVACKVLAKVLKGETSGKVRPEMEEMWSTVCALS